MLSVLKLVAQELDVLTVLCVVSPLHMLHVYRGYRNISSHSRDSVLWMDQCDFCFILRLFRFGLYMSDYENLLTIFKYIQSFILQAYAKKCYH